MRAQHVRITCLTENKHPREQSSPSGPGPQAPISGPAPGRLKPREGEGVVRTIDLEIARNLIRKFVIKATGYESFWAQLSEAGLVTTDTLDEWI